jgi:protein-tyrosine phosphatase
MKSILVVCEGNICRSPMAAGLLSVALPKLHVHSAGLNALHGMPAAETAVRVMAELGIDIARHRAVQVTRDMCQRSDLVLVMSAEQRKRLEGKYPFACGKVFRIGEFSTRDVPDPYRRPEAAFREALEIIDDGVKSWLQRIHRI